MRYFQYLLSVSMIVVVSFWTMNLLAATSGDGQTMRLNGTVLFSFDSDHVVIQTVSRNYLIAKSKMGRAMQDLVAQESFGQASETFILPRESIVTSWPSERALNRSKNAGHDHKPSLVIHESMTEADGLMEIVGTLAMSQSEEFVIIQMNNDMYRINKFAASELQRRQLDRASPGEQVAIALPLIGICFTWSAASNGLEVAQLPRVQDRLESDGQRITMLGTAQLSFEPSYYVLESRGVYFRVQGNSIEMHGRKGLDIPGTRVKLEIPVGAVATTWSSKGTIPNFAKKIHESMM